MAARVFVTNYTEHDYKPAEQYGELVFITKGYVSFKNLDRLKSTIYEGLKDSTEEDWLCISGHGVLSALACVIWFAKHGKINMLIYDTKTKQDYKELFVTKERLQTMFEVLSGDGT